MCWGRMVPRSSPITHSWRQLASKQWHRSRQPPALPASAPRLLLTLFLQSASPASPPGRLPSPLVLLDAQPLLGGSRPAQPSSRHPQSIFLFPWEPHGPPPRRSQGPASVTTFISPHPGTDGCPWPAAAMSTHTCASSTELPSTFSAGGPLPAGDLGPAPDLRTGSDMKTACHGASRREGRSSRETQKIMASERHGEDNGIFSVLDSLSSS